MFFRDNVIDLMGACREILGKQTVLAASKSAIKDQFPEQ